MSDRYGDLDDAHTQLAGIRGSLLRGMAEATDDLPTCDPLSGEEAEPVGLVALAGGPRFHASVVYEMLGFGRPDAREALASRREKRSEARFE